jgi:hypothetical protein
VWNIQDPLAGVAGRRSLWGMRHAAFALLAFASACAREVFFLECGPLADVNEPDGIVLAGESFCGAVSGPGDADSWTIGNGEEVETELVLNFDLFYSEVDRVACPAGEVFVRTPGLGVNLANCATVRIGPVPPEQDVVFSLETAPPGEYFGAATFEPL